MESFFFFKGKSNFFKFLIILFLVVFGFSLSNIFAFFLVELIWDKTQITTLPEAIRVVLLLSSIGVFLLPGVLYLYLDQNRESESFKKRNILFQKLSVRNQYRSFFILFLIAIPIILVIGIIGEWNQSIQFPESMKHLETWMKHIEDSNQKTIQLLTQNTGMSSLLINLLVMAVVPAFCEEIFFRGALQQFFSAVFKNKHIVIFITAFIFSTIHFQFFGFIPRLLLGLYLGYLAIWSGSLFLPIMAHFLHNALSLLFDFFSQKNYSNAPDISLLEIPGIAFIFVISCFFITIGLLDIYKHKNSV